MNGAEALEYLETALKHFEKFYICVDALDECNLEHRSEFLELISGLLDNFGTSVRIFMTGRPLMDIQVKESFAFSKRTITLRANEGDIRKYIHHQLELGSSYVHTDDAFRKDIVDKIAETADGMLVSKSFLILYSNPNILLRFLLPVLRIKMFLGLPSTRGPKLL